MISRPSKDRAVIDAGSKAFSETGGFPMAKDILGVKVFHLSGEHGILRLNKPSVDLNVGDVIEFVPA